MANSEEVMTRLAKLEANVATMTSDIGDLKHDTGEMKRDIADLKVAAWRTTEILIDHSQHLSRLQQSTDGLQRSMDGMQRTMDERLGAVTDRLDRLIAVTIQERTASTERLGDIERRLARLEERVGI
jgi:chromosome segregation ATPase